MDTSLKSCRRLKISYRIYREDKKISILCPVFVMASFMLIHLHTHHATPYMHGFISWAAFVSLLLHFWWTHNGTKDPLDFNLFTKGFWQKTDPANAYFAWMAKRGISGGNRKKVNSTIKPETFPLIFYRIVKLEWNKHEKMNNSKIYFEYFFFFFFYNLSFAGLFLHFFMFVHICLCLMLL